MKRRSASTVAPVQILDLLVIFFTLHKPRYPVHNLTDRQDSRIYHVVGFSVKWPAFCHKIPYLPFRIFHIQQRPVFVNLRPLHYRLRVGRKSYDNTAGFQTGTTPPLVAAYTSTGRGEAIVYSNDGGRSFTEYEGNPAVKHQGRDPRLLWYAPGQHWVMAVYDEIEKGRYVAFYTSPDLKQWTFQSRIEGYFECPELFELPVDGKEKHSKWILYAADGAYAIGAFDGKTFTPDGPKQRYNYGDCFYASQTFSAMPDGDKRRVQIAWGQTGQADMPFNQMMNFPVELTLRKTGDGPYLFANPVQEIEKLHREGHTWKRLHLKPGINPLSEVHGELIHIRLRFSPGDAEEVGLNIRGTKVSYDVRANALTCNGKTAPLRPEHGDITVELLADRLSLEIFANDGLVYMPMQAHPDPADRNLELYSKNGDAKIKLLEVFDLDSIWTTGGSASVER